MILDYTTHQTIKICLASRKADSHTSSSKILSSTLAMSDAFLPVFRARHPTYTPDTELRLRILLLKLATLFTQRLTSNPTTPPQQALQALRAHNQERARTWIGSADRIPSGAFETARFDEELPINQIELERNRAHVLNELGIPAEDEIYEDAFYGTSSCITLLDLLPLFMQVSAARNAMNESNLTELWMELACEFMLQACLEQYLVLGTHGTDAVDEAFAWGYQRANSDHRDSEAGQNEDKDDGDEVNEMFEDQDYTTEVEDWSDTMTTYISQLFPPGSKSEGSIFSVPSSDDEDSGTIGLVPHLEAVATQYPIAAFEMSLLSFLEALSKSISEPVLHQLEIGKLAGMTEQQTSDFLADCGIASLAWPELAGTSD